MQSNNLNWLIEQVSSDERDKKDKFLAAIADSIEVGVVVPSILRRNLTDAGFAIVEDKASMSEYGFASLATLERVLITDSKGALVAMGAAGDPSEALLHAALGYVREHRLPDSEANDGILTASVNPLAN